MTNDIDPTEIPDAEIPQPTGAAGHTIDMGEWSDAWLGQTVTIRPFLSYAANQRIEDTLLAIEMQTAGGNRAQRRAARHDPAKMTARTRSVEHAVAVIEEAVLSWTLLDAAGQPLPANRHGVTSEQAPYDLIDTAVGEILDYYEARRPKRRTRSE